MKINSTFHALVFFMAVLMFSTPFATLAQQHLVRVEAEAAAKRDAEARTQKPAWFIFGCVGGLLTVAYVYLYEPTIPAGTLLGKSPEYVAFYTDAYTLKAKDIQMKAALGGCVTSAIAWGVLIAISVVASESGSSSGYYYY